MPPNVKDNPPANKTPNQNEDGPRGSGSSHGSVFSVVYTDQNGNRIPDDQIGGDYVFIPRDHFDFVQIIADRAGVHMDFPAEGGLELNLDGEPYKSLEPFWLEVVNELS